ncbi:MAG: hypothetical protein ABWK00_00775 [Desulfurococcaceae archaeon]
MPELGSQSAAGKPDKPFRAIGLPVVSPLHDPAAVKASLELYRKRVGGLVEISEPVEESGKALSVARGADALVVPVITGGTEHIVVALGELGIPILLLAHDGQNSLPAALEAMARLRHDGRRAALALLDDGVERRVDAFLRAAKALTRLRNSTMLIVGRPSDWLVYGNLPEQWKFLEALGLRPEPIDIGALEDLARRTREGVPKDLERFARAEIFGASKDDLGPASGVYAALKALLLERGARYATVRCFDLVKDLRTTGCLALSALNDEGYVVGCEGDLPATITMAVLREISGQPAFMGNLAWISGGKLLLAHCTVATSLVARFRLRTHFESGIGIAIQGYPRRGETVTVARIDGARRLLRAMRAVVLNDAPLREDNCRTQFLLDVGPGIERLLRDPVGNHHALVPGDWIDALATFADLAGLELELIR